MWLDIFLDRTATRQTSAALYEQIRAAVAGGRLAPGDQLPTSRWLAADLGISRSTVSTVFGRLVAEGILDARVGDGTYVAEHPLVGSAAVAPRRSATLTRRAPSATPLGRAGCADSIDLRTGRPDPALFPLADWRRAVRGASELAPPGYGHAAGLPALRTAIAAWVGRSRGLAVDPDHVLVTSGAQQAFELCAQVLLADGDVVAFEEPGYEPARRSFLTNGAVVHPVRVDREGIVVDEIPADARAVYVTPSHQAPTGSTMSTARRRALIALARSQHLAVIEDDYDTEFRYVERPLEPLHRLDPDGYVVYIGTFSKSLSPSLRIGFIVASPDLVADLTTARRTHDVQPPHLPQAALAHLIVSGAFERHIRRSRAAYTTRHRVVERRITALAAAGLVAAPWPSKAGLHTMVELLDGVDVSWVRDQLEEAGVVAETTDDSWFGTPRPALTIGFGLTDEAGLERAFDVLSDVLSR